MRQPGRGDACDAATRLRDADQYPCAHVPATAAGARAPSKFRRQSDQRIQVAPGRPSSRDVDQAIEGIGSALFVASHASSSSRPVSLVRSVVSAR